MNATSAVRNFVDQPGGSFRSPASLMRQVAEDQRSEPCSSERHFVRRHDLPDGIVGRSTALRTVIESSGWSRRLIPRSSSAARPARGRSCSLTRCTTEARVERRIVKCNCAAFPSGLLESECSVTKKAPSRAQPISASDGSSSLIAGRSFSTRLVKLRSTSAKAAACAPGAEFERGRLSNGPCRRAARGGYQRETSRNGRREAVPRRSLLPVERVSHSASGAARTAGGYSAARQTLRAPLCVADGPADQVNSVECDGGSGQVPPGPATFASCRT